MRVVGTLVWLAICLAPLSVAQAKPINSAMAFAAYVVANEPERVAAMISGPVEQVSGAEFLPGEKPSGERLFAALSDCKFVAIFDEMPTANFAPERRSIEASWVCGATGVRVSVEPWGDKVRLKYLKIRPMIGAPAAPTATAPRGQQ